MSRYDEIAKKLDDLIPGAQGMPSMQTAPLDSYPQMKAMATVFAAELDALEAGFDAKLEDFRSRVTGYVELKPGEEPA